MATTRPGPAPPAGGARREEESRAEPPPPLATCSCHGSSKRRAAEVSDPLHVRVHCPRDPWRAPADRATSSPRTKPRGPGGRRSHGVVTDKGEAGSRVHVALVSHPPGSPGLPWVPRALRFLFSGFLGRKYLVPNWQVCPVPASARRALVWKVLRLAHRNPGAGCRQECGGNFGHYG